MTGESTPQDPGRDLLEALVDGARASLRPAAGAKKQTWKRVVSSVAVGTPLPLEPSTIVGPMASAKATAPWLKVVLGLVLGGAVAAGGVAVASRDEPTAAVAIETRTSPQPDRDEAVRPAASAAQRSRPTTAAPTETPAEAIVPELPGAPLAGAAAAPSPMGPGPAPPASAPPAPPSQPRASDLAEETRLLARARARMRSGEPTGALEPLAEHARRFPQGQLTEDRMVLRAQALCESGDTEAGRRQATALRQTFPDSSHLPRVTRTCSDG
jgi:hypothetical protein